MEEIGVLSKLHPGLSYIVVGAEVNANESTIGILKAALKQKHT